MQQSDAQRSQFGTKSVLIAVFGFATISVSCTHASGGVTTSVSPAPAESKITDEDAEYFTDHPLMVPVDGVRPQDVRDTFNEARDGTRVHRATDILAPRETPVIAAIAGRVMRMRQNANGGIVAWLIDEDSRYVFYYAHLSHYSDNITEGLRVPQGFVIGYVGTSGNAPPDTPHLHFQAMRVAPNQHDWWNGTPVDVRAFMKIPGKAIE